MDEAVRELSKLYKKKEIQEIAEELLEEEPELSVSKAGLIEQILDDLDENGIPDTSESDNCSELLYDFLIEAGYIDADGNVIPFDEEVGDEGQEGQEEDDEYEGDVDDVPECYGFADSRDPACKKCLQYDDCVKVRISNRPDCFGILYNATEAECNVCLESSSCKIQKEKL